MSKRVYRLLVAAIGILASVAVSMAVAPAASASSISEQGNDFAGLYHYGDISKGYVYVDSSVEIYQDDNYDAVKIRGHAQIEKGNRVLRVQIDKVVLGDAGRAVTQTTIAASSGTGGKQAVKNTAWIAVKDGTCSRYRIRVYYSVRWDDGTLSKFSRLAPFTYDYFCRR